MRLQTSVLIAVIALVLPLSILGEHWYTYVICGILVPVSFCGTWLGYPSGDKVDNVKEGGK